MQRNFMDALNDFRAGLAMWRVWMALAQEDIGDQHRRTTLGPLWLLINYLSFAGTFIFIFDRGHGVANYPAYVAVGLLVWFYIMETINQAVILFTREESFIKGTTLPLSIYVFRLTAQSIVRAGYALFGCAILLLLSGVSVSAVWGWSGLGILIIVLTTPPAIISFAFLGAFFPDSQFIVSNLMRLGMFLTPIFWTHDGAGGARAFLYYWNPFTYFVEIVRQPIVAGTVPWQAFSICLTIGLVLWIIALLLFTRFRRDVVFVL